jgi:hypothetical protein
MTAPQRRPLPRLTMWVDSTLVVDTDADCPTQLVDLVSVDTTEGRDSWRDDCQPGQLSLAVMVDDPAGLERWTIGATVAIALHGRTILGQPRSEWLGVWSVQEVRSTPEQVGQRWKVQVTGTDYVGVAATTPRSAPGTWRYLPTGASWQQSTTPIPETDATKLDEFRWLTTPIGTVATDYTGTPPATGDLPEGLGHGWTATRIVTVMGQTLQRPGGPLAWLAVTVDLCQILAGSMAWQLTTAGNIDTVIAHSKDGTLGEEQEFVLSTWSPGSGHPEVRWDLDGSWFDPMNALAVAAEALAAVSGGARWDLAEAEIDLSLPGPSTTAELVGLHAPWSLIDLTGPLPQVAPPDDVGVHRTVDRIAHHIAWDEHTVTVTLGDPVPTAKPIRYTDPTDIGGATVVPEGATFTGATAWEHAGKSFDEVGRLGLSL